MRMGSDRRAGLILATAALLAASGCSTGRPDQFSQKPADVHVTERDFRISAPKRVSPGEVRVSIRNKGPDDHEFIVVRVRGAGLPMRPDGLTVDEDAIEKATAAALEPARPGVHELRVRLRPGRYELLCNMYGHYAGGMHTRLDVHA
jgi:uncharacterized cupredoxin-like copper-binding protein